MTGVMSSLVAVVGTLAGGLLTGLLQVRLSRTARLASRDEARRVATLSAVTALVSALADHRRAMWVREDERLTGVGFETWAANREATHVTRSAIEAPLVTVTILAPRLAGVAREAVEATYALRNATTQAKLIALRESALTAVDRLTDAAGGELR